MYKITLPIRFAGVRYGIDFAVDHKSNRGVGYSDNEYMLRRLVEKGFTVEKVEEDGEEVALSQFNREKARQKVIEKFKQQESEIKLSADESEAELTEAEQQIAEERKTTRNKKK